MRLVPRNPTFGNRAAAAAFCAHFLPAFQSAADPGEPCTSGSESFRAARVDLEALDRRFRKLASPDSIRSGQDDLRRLLEGRCFAENAALLDDYASTSATSFKAWWTSGGHEWVLSLLDHHQHTQVRETLWMVLLAEHVTPIQTEAVSVKVPPGLQIRWPLEPVRSPGGCAMGRAAHAREIHWDWQGDSGPSGAGSFYVDRVSPGHLYAAQLLDALADKSANLKAAPTRSLPPGLMDRAWRLPSAPRPL